MRLAVELLLAQVPQGLSASQCSVEDQVGQAPVVLSDLRAGRCLSGQRSDGVSAQIEVVAFAVDHNETICAIEGCAVKCLVDRDLRVLEIISDQFMQLLV